MNEMNEEQSKIESFSPTILPPLEKADSSEDTEKKEGEDALSSPTLAPLKMAKPFTPTNCSSCGVIITIKCDCCPECGSSLSKNAGMFL